MSPKLCIKKSDVLDDWYVIERAEHDGREWYEKKGNVETFKTSARISDACVEGSLQEMEQIADAILARAHFSAKRCAVAVIHGVVEFWSPRNSRTNGATSLKQADALATQIKAIRSSNCR